VAALDLSRYVPRAGTRSALLIQSHAPARPVGMVSSSPLPLFGWGFVCFVVDVGVGGCKSLILAI